MCGIFALLNNENGLTEDFIFDQFDKGSSRGPEFSKLSNAGLKIKFGFHRLAINGLNANSNQPIKNGYISLICNGEIYNYKELYALMDVTPETGSDCEVIIHLYLHYGIEQTLQMLDGVFSFVLCDNTNVDKLDNFLPSNKVYVARDPYGVRPLYILENFNPRNNLIGFASELKCLSEFQKKCPGYIVSQFAPGTYSCYELPFNAIASWFVTTKNKSYHSTGFNSIYGNSLVFDENGSGYGSGYKGVLANIRHYFTRAIEKRYLTTERPIACLLSGGLDSSLVTALVNEFHKKNPKLKPLETYSIGLAGSEDLKHAKIVADYLGTKHTEIIVSEQDFLDAIPSVVYAIESYDTTTVRASIGNFLLGKYIARYSDAKVIFNGDGSDELCGGYLYMNKCPNAIEFDRETRRLLKDIHLFDVLRSDKCISSWGLEPRTPFLDRTWVQYYLSIHPSIRYHPGNKQCEKHLLRTAFSGEHFLNSEKKQILPDSILWRRKEAFSDGVTKLNKSLYQIIDESLAPVEPHKTSDNGVEAITNEQKYYKSLFEKHYPDAVEILPYYWMPKYVNARDASARTLDLYNEK
jgi:asparagine synthase (glutamine-hydrolysing)